MIMSNTNDSHFINTDGKPKYYKIDDAPWILKRTYDGSYYSYEKNEWRLVAKKRASCLSGRDYSAAWDLWIIQNNIKEISEKEAFIEIL